MERIVDSTQTQRAMSTTADRELLERNGVKIVSNACEKVIEKKSAK